MARAVESMPGQPVSARESLVSWSNRVNLQLETLNFNQGGTRTLFALEGKRVFCFDYLTVTVNVNSPPTSFGSKGRRYASLSVVVPAPIA